MNDCSYGTFKYSLQTSAWRWKKEAAVSWTSPVRRTQPRDGARRSSQELRSCSEGEHSQPRPRFSGIPILGPGPSLHPNLQWRPSKALEGGLCTHTNFLQRFWGNQGPDLKVGICLQWQWRGRKQFISPLYFHPIFPLFKFSINCSSC